MDAKLNRFQFEIVTEVKTDPRRATAMDSNPRTLTGTLPPVPSYSVIIFLPFYYFMHEVSDIFAVLIN